jgi:molecular chaperone DnaJ
MVMRAFGAEDSAAALTGSAVSIFPTPCALSCGISEVSEVLTIFSGLAHPGPNGGQDLQVKLELTLEEISQGVEKTLKVKRFVGCESCKGSGAEPGTRPARCPTCAGQGQVRRVSKTLFGQFVNVQSCPNCGGTGQVIESRCHNCGGSGLEKASTKIKVKIPAGVAAGNYLTVRGSGNFGPNGGPPGDVLVVIDEKEHEYFTRRGDDVIFELPISISQAVLGAEIDIPTLDGDASLKIPSGTQSGKIFLMKNKGIPHLNSYGSSWSGWWSGPPPNCPTRKKICSKK